MSAIYQWFPDAGTPPATDDFLDYEFVLMATDQSWRCRYIGLNFDTGIATDFGQFNVGKNVSVISNGNTVIVDMEGTNRHPHEFVWRGHTFSDVATGGHGGTGGVTKHMVPVGDNKVIFTATEFDLTLGNQGRFVGYQDVLPYNFTNDIVELTPVVGKAFWLGFFDINYGLAGERGYGDAFVSIASRGSDMAAFIESSGALVEQTRLSTVIDYPTVSGINFFGHDPNSGYIANMLQASGIAVHFFRTNPTTLTTTYLGQDGATGLVTAVGFSPNADYFVALEQGGAFTYTLRAYTFNPIGPTITLVDQMDFEGATSTAAHFQVSRVSGRIWLTASQAGVGGLGTKVFHIDPLTDTIVLDFELEYSAGSSGYLGNPLAFLEDPLTITSNGFSGIKEKLFECWEMDEVGSVTRIGAMGKQNLPVDAGTVTNRAGWRHGQAADFSTSALAAEGTAMAQEIQTVDNFSICVDVVLDSKAADEYIISRGRKDILPTVNPQYRDWSLIYDAGLDRFKFSVNSGVNEYTVVANNFGSPVTGTNYHIYFEYNKTNDTISIRVANSTVDTTSLPAGMSLNAYFGSTWALTLGRFSTTVAHTRYMDGSADQMFWFWDVLTPAEQTWMYDSGDGRAFSEL